MQSTWCDGLMESINSDSKWIPSIFIPSSCASFINQYLNLSKNFIDNSLLNNEYNNSVHVDIVQLLNYNIHSLTSLLNELSRLHDYPQSAIFHFEGYDSIDDKDRLIEDIKHAALKQGTILNIEKGYNPNPKNIKLLTITLACNHYGKHDIDKTSHSTKKWEDGMLQQTNTIIQPHHHSSSVHKRSRHATLNRTVSSSNKSSDIKGNRSSTYKCKCLFNISIMFDHSSSRWFLKRKRSKSSDVLYHTNHIYINPSHLEINKNNIPNHVKENILSLIHSGTPITYINHIVKSQYGINVDYQTIYRMRDNQINDLLKSLSASDPSGAPVDNLINIFKRTENVSFVYVLHKYNSGFVTYRKNRNQRDLHNTQNSSSFCGTSTHNWRDELKLKHSNDILVAFAWAHDDEIRATEMFPEFLGADVTFGVNRQRRELLLVVGIDGRNRTFTSFRCFIPSKQEQVYTWIFNEAMPHLLSNNVLKFNQCISTDNELSLNFAVGTSVFSNKDSFKNSKLRLDCYHFYRKVWLEKVVLKCRNNSSAKKVLNVMNRWILTWFKTLETKEEIEISHNLLKYYLSTKQSLIGDAATEEATTLVKKIISQQKFLLHPYFKNIATFDFIGDSIVESANFNLKKGPISVNNNMDIACSALTQVKATEKKSSKEIVKSAKKINVSKIWTISKTSKYLTDYAEGIACANFDRKDQYTSRYIGLHTWVVCASSVIDDILNNRSDKQLPPTFSRVRIVSLDNNGYMNCSCGYPQRFLMPCTHICKIITDKDYYTADLFHIRWWKHFHYFFKNSSSDKHKKTCESTYNTLNNMRMNNYNTHDGSYKGINLNGTPLLSNILNGSRFTTDIQTQDLSYDIMSYLKDKMDNNEPILKGSKDIIHKFSPTKQHNNQHDNYVGDEDSLSKESFDNNFDTMFDTSPSDVDNMGAGSQVLSQLSEFRGDIEKCQVNPNEESTTDKSKTFYSRIDPVYKSLLNNIQSEQQLQESITTLEKLSFKFAAESLTSKRNIGDNETTFLGEVHGSGRPEKRHKNFYEMKKK